MSPALSTRFKRISKTFSYHPFQVDYDHRSGHAPSRLPANETFWVKSTGGARNLALDWKPRPGSWRAVVMNADASRGVTAGPKFGVRTSLLWWFHLRVGARYCEARYKRG